MCMYVDIFTQQLPYDNKHSKYTWTLEFYSKQTWFYIKDE